MKNGIKRISIIGLHDQYDAELNFGSGLNIIYGKNGGGKTTILHILANALELDFYRFRFLKFKRIIIENFNNDHIVIINYNQEQNPKVIVNGAEISYDENGILIDSHYTESDLRNMLGEIPTYLPAFRSVLERARTDMSSYYRESELVQNEINRLTEKEYKSIKKCIEESGNVGLQMTARAYKEEAASNARKTIQCRKWFGEFVPTTRHPSMLDVEDGITEEWRNARFQLSRNENTMYQEMFVKVFDTLASKVSNPYETNNESLLESIEAILKSEEYQEDNDDSHHIYESLKRAVKNISQKTQFAGIENAVLDLYLKGLEDRKTSQINAFRDIKKFEQSVNKFLDGKKLKIGIANDNSFRRRAVFVKSNNDTTHSIFALSSGERQIITMLFSASRSRFSRGIFLVDEPELSLHIDWQRIILTELKNQCPERQIIACTHSPEVGADNFEFTMDYEPTPTVAKHDVLTQVSLFGEEDL